MNAARPFWLLLSASLLTILLNVIIAHVDGNTSAAVVGKSAMILRQLKERDNAELATRFQKPSKTYSIVVFHLIVEY